MGRGLWRLDPSTVKAKILDPFDAIHYISSMKSFGSIYISEKRSNNAKGLDCCNCFKEAEVMHHIVPWSLGGKTMVPLCRACHSLAHQSESSKSQLIKSALKKAQAKGVRLGRPKKIGIKLIKEIRHMRFMGHSYRDIEKQLNVSPGTIKRAIDWKP
jgi:hypothetical protein